MLVFIKTNTAEDKINKRIKNQVEINSEQFSVEISLQEIA